MKKRILFIIALVMILPTFVYAKEDAELYEKFYKILGEDSKLKITDINTLDTFHLNSKQATDAYDLGFSRVISSYIYEMPEVKKLLKQYADENPKISAFCKSYENCGISIVYDSDTRDFGDEVDFEYPSPYLKHYDVEIEVTEDVDDESYKFLQNKLASKLSDESKVYKDFYLYDLAYINMLYNIHNGNYDPAGGDMPFIDKMTSNPTLIAKNFPEIKDFLTDNPSYDVKYAMFSNMGSANTNTEFVRTADYVLYKDNTAYLQSTFVFHISPVLFIEDTVDDEKIVEAARDRIKDFINNDNVPVEVKNVTNTYSEEELNEIRSDLGNLLADSLNIEHFAGATVCSLRMADMDGDSHIFVVKTSKENIKKLEVQAIEKTTGFRFTSNSISIPIDSDVLIDDCTDQYIEMNPNVLKAYDINLYSNTKEAFIKSIFGGVKIYIPVDDNFEMTDKQVVYLSSNGEVSEEFDSKVETVKGQKYVSFTTNHLSVYGIIDTKAEINNPKTGDKSNLVLWLSCIMMSLFVIVIIAKYVRKVIEK